MGKEGGEQSSQVKSKKKKSIEEKDECRFQGYKA